MVHSGSASPVKTTPSASPHLTVPATAAPLAPPPGDTTDQDPTQTSAILLTTDITSNSDLTQPSTPTPADAEPPVVTPAKAQSPDPAQGLFNGRTSGRKRTPKACDCCGPNSTGHNVRNSGRGRGRGKGRGRVPGSDLWDTPKRKVGGQLTHIRSFDLTKEMVEEAEDEDDRHEKRQGPNKDAEMDHEDQTDPSSLQSASGNGDTVNLSDTEPEEDAMADNMIISGLENGLPSISRQSGPASRSGSPQDLDTEMQVDQTRLDRTDLVSEPVTLSNGNIATPTNEDHCSTLMEVETSNPAMVAPPSQGPITVSSMQHHWAIRDHTLYCQSGTWEKKEMELSGKDGREIDGKTQDEESLEQLTDMIHEFLESFYMKYGGFIPLSETDVLEYLKQKGNSDLSNKGVDIKREMTRYRAGLASAPIAGFMVTYNKHTLGLEDLGTLEEQNWLNDQIINMYGELIMEATQHKVHFFNSFFHKQLVAKGYDGVKRWTKKVDLFSKWLLLIPIHLEIHWSLVTVTMATKTISYYDSQGIVFRHTTDNIMKYLLSEAREKKQTAFQKGWKITIIKGIPQQKNDSDCGVFVLEYCRCLSVKQPLLFSQEDMPRIRKRIYKELCDCRLND
ncbi:sentrin-specific protease 3 isoform X2 [Dicentrarchus labrax]|uniref:sentrin-specific protease 3 isoform X2 n=1 Tax=Dicentrarchus labrax TaxID=13489 RepID=UPI0021F62B0D|nr:sentrin-specific protease 3 isoform X2 [Dicentrarchus labrax]